MVTDPVNMATAPFNSTIAPVNMATAPVNTIAAPVYPETAPVNQDIVHVNVATGPVNMATAPQSCRLLPNFGRPPEFGRFQEIAQKIAQNFCAIFKIGQKHPKKLPNGTKT